MKWEKLRSSQSSTWFLTETIFFCFSEAQSMRKRHHLHRHQIMVWNLLNHLTAMSIHQDCLGKIAFRYHTFWKSCSQDPSHVTLLLLLLHLSSSTWYLNIFCKLTKLVCWWTSLRNTLSKKSSWPLSLVCVSVSLSPLSPNLREDLQAKFQIEFSSLNPPEYIHI